MSTTIGSANIPPGPETDKYMGINRVLEGLFPESHFWSESSAILERMVRPKTENESETMKRDLGGP